MKTALTRSAFRPDKIVLSLAIFLMLGTVTYAQDNVYRNNSQNHSTSWSNFGNTFNIGVGYIYSSDYYYSVPIVMINYEFKVARDFTLAPFVGFASYTSASNYYYYNQNYYYNETIIPLGVKGTYYFNRLLNLNRRWDLYGAASLGYVIDNVSWQNGYDGGHSVNNSPVFLDLHAGAEYHITRRVGIFADLAVGNESVSTIGLAFHKW